MAENGGNPTALTLLVTLFSPGFRVGKLLPLEGRKIPAGQMQQVALERRGALAGCFQRLMHLVVVVTVVAWIEAGDAVGIPAAVAHKAPEEQVAPGDAVDAV